MADVWPWSWVIKRRAKKIRNIRDNEFEQRESWCEFRQKLLEYLADDGPITEEVWQEAEDFWRAGVEDLVSRMPTEKAENVFVAEQLSNGFLDER
jgi:hypothetical protein